MEMKTSAAWYALEPKKNMADPDGWRNEADPQWFWHTVPVTYNEYRERMSLCTRDGRLSESYPFGQTPLSGMYPRRTRQSSKCLLV